MTLEFVPFGLFDFQEEEVDRLFIQKSRLLAWEMGTGKTYGGAALDVENKGRSIAAMNESVPREVWDGPPKNDVPRKTLIICPKSVIDVWDEHCMELTDQDVYVIDTNNRAPFLR